MIIFKSSTPILLSTVGNFEILFFIYMLVWHDWIPCMQLIFPINEIEKLTLNNVHEMKQKITMPKRNNDESQSVVEKLGSQQESRKHNTCVQTRSWVFYELLLHQYFTISIM